MPTSCYYLDLGLLIDAGELRFEDRIRDERIVFGEDHQRWNP